MPDGLGDTIQLGDTPGGLGVFEQQPQGAPLDLRPTRARPVVGHYGPETDEALRRAAELGIGVALPLGMAGLGGPAAMGLRSMGPAIIQSLLGPGTHQDPNILQGTAMPEPPDELNAAKVLAAMTAKKKLSYGDWEKANPGIEEGFLDFAGAKPALPERSGPLPRYVPERGTSARMADALADPQVGKVLRAAAKNGAALMPEDWYATSPLYEVFQREWGEQAPQIYKRYMDFIAGSSPQNKVPDNIKTQSWYWYMDRTGQPLPEKPAPGYGHYVQKLHMQNARNIQAGTWDPLQNPKPPSFSENLLGNEVPITSDIHNFRLLGMASQDPRFLETSVPIENANGTKGVFNARQAFLDGKLTMKDALKNPNYWADAPNENEYAAYEAYQQQMAKKLGMTPAGVQSKMWVGGGGVGGKVPGLAPTGTGLGSPPESFIRTVAKRVMFTAQQLKASPDEVLQKYVRGEIPLLALPAAAAPAALRTLRGQQPARQEGIQ